MKRIDIGLDVPPAHLSADTMIAAPEYLNDMDRYYTTYICVYFEKSGFTSYFNFN